MKKLPFTKMAGAGNDFIIIEPKKGFNYKKLAQKVCDRTNGIGADGLLILDHSKRCDYKMCIVNADGSQAEMCGNGARCLAAYIVHNKKPQKKIFSIETLAGEILAEAKKERAQVRLNDPVQYKSPIPLNINGRKIHVSYIDTGVPHTVVYVNDLQHIDVKKIGNLIRYNPKFQPRGTNVNFAEQMNQNFIAIRTYERGVENETKACGTGSVAVALVTYLQSNPMIQNKKKATMNIRTQGGEILEVTFDLIQGKMTNVWLKGSAKFIAKGEYYV